MGYSVCFQKKLIIGSGPEDYDRLRPLSYFDTDIFLICFGVISETAFRNVKSKWVPEVTHHRPQAKLVLVGTKADLRTNTEFLTRYQDDRRHRIVQPFEGEALAKEIGAVAYIETSALDGYGVDELSYFLTMVHMAHPETKGSKKKKGVCKTQ